MAELYGKLEGCSHGYGGSMHLYDIERGNMGANAVVGGGLPATVGAALAFKLRGEPHVAVAFFGDGATNIGTFHESMNLAQLWRVPVVFVCENNRWSESTPQSQHQPIRDLTQRASAYGMPALQVDGQDVEAVHLAALEALGHARAGRGPVFLLCETERLTGHYIGDPQVYRDKEKLRKLRETRDPIQNLRTRLGPSDEEWARLEAEAQSVVDASLEFADPARIPIPATRSRTSMQSSDEAGGNHPDALEPQERSPAQRGEIDETCSDRRAPEGGKRTPRRSTDLRGPALRSRRDWPCVPQRLSLGG
jgi:acetoin:2,6-dichlorophenolindophenol oxidoreductase subunit alpha